MSRLRNEKGVVLLLVLAIVALLSALLVEFAFSTLVDMRLTETFRDSTRAWYLAKGGVQAGRMILKEDGRLTKTDHLGELWAQPFPYMLDEGQTVTITIEDANRKINLNQIVTKNPTTNKDNPNVVVMKQFNNLLDNLGVNNADVLIDSLIDWIDNDSSARTDGAEANYYQTLDSPYPIKNGKLDALEELLMVRGFTQEVFNVIREHVTLHGDGKININTAGEEVLMASDAMIDRAQAQDIVSRRENAPFKDTAELNSISGLGTLLRTPYSVTSNAFTIAAEAVIGDEGGRRTATAVADHSGNISYLKVD